MSGSSSSSGGSSTENPVTSGGSTVSGGATAPTPEYAYVVTQPGNANPAGGEFGVGTPITDPGVISSLGLATASWVVRVPYDAVMGG